MLIHDTFYARQVVAWAFPEVTTDITENPFQGDGKEIFIASHGEFV